MFIQAGEFKSKVRKMGKHTQLCQFKELVAFMVDNPEIAKGFSKTLAKDETRSQRWDDISMKLNNLGPPMHDARGWKKVWADYKLYIKKKLQHNVQEGQKTGGGPCNLQCLTSLEETVARIADLYTAVNGSKSFGLKRSAPTATPSPHEAKAPKPSPSYDMDFDLYLENPDEIDIKDEVLDAENHISDEANITVPSPSTTKSKKESTPDANNLNSNLGDYMEMQKEFAEKVCDTMAANNSSLSRIYMGIEKQNEEQSRHNHAMEKLFMQKLEIKKKMLELEEKRAIACIVTNRIKSEQN